MMIMPIDSQSVVWYPERGIPSDMIEFRLFFPNTIDTETILIDDEDQKRVFQHRWWINKSETGCRVFGWVGDETIPLANFILRVDRNFIVDHKNRDYRNNTKENLRIATKSQNQANREKQSNNRSGYKGVSWFKRDCCWRAYITKKSVQYHLGYFADPIEAAKAYDKEAKRIFGKFACLNFQEKEEN